jgi:hypothetical protein
MVLRRIPTGSIFTALLGVACLMASGHAQGAKHALQYEGTIGQQHVRLTLQTDGDIVSDADYQYDSQPGKIAFSENRVFGTTIVLADDDGNMFHLHLRNADGTTAPDIAHAQKLDGTMDRGELDLPVNLTRLNGTSKQ